MVRLVRSREGQRVSIIHHHDDHLQVNRLGIASATSTVVEAHSMIL